jgi:stearoyl-CoA desaturase (delta-9 desaturase)
MALFTFGEGYHNYHHEFQHDYRNGIRWYHWDPTKWSVWLLSKVGLASDLRRVPDEKIVLTEIAEARRRLEKRISNEKHPLTDKLRELVSASDAKLVEMSERWQTWISTPRQDLPNYLHDIKASLKETRMEIQRAFALAASAS